ncbi:MAG: peptidoglycan bridge formation glycyltransferase FemA/FemB family protein [Emcibacter sp.]|nr:peptidoglycan bridge formation glycyltransferase FemA/FemB family protein [Emcibacter sp.]
MSQININWNGISQKEWDILLNRAERCAFQQAWAYGAIFEQNNREVSRFVACDNGEAVAIGQIITRRYLGFLRFSFLLKGPVWLKTITIVQQKEILQNIRARYPLKRFNLFAFNPEEKAGMEKYEDMGFREIITGNSTVLIDLTVSEDALWKNLYGKNRTDIRKAEKSGFEVIFGDHNSLYADWLLKKERRQQKEKKYQGLPAELSKSYGQIYSPEQGVFTAFAVKKEPDSPHSPPISGILVLRHGKSATYHIGWNGKEGRKCRALNLLLWRMMLRLQQAGVETLDFGGINTTKAADIARYKLSFGGDVVEMSGTYM